MLIALVFTAKAGSRFTNILGLAFALNENDYFESADEPAEVVEQLTPKRI